MSVLSKTDNRHITFVYFVIGKNGNLCVQHPGKRVRFQSQIVPYSRDRNAREWQTAQNIR